MSEMVERVAINVRNTLSGLPKPPDERDWIRAAEVAIGTMGEPTPEMGQAGYKAWDDFGEDAIMGPAEIIAIWRAMSAAALTDGG